MLNSIIQLIEKLNTEQDCINFLIKARWNDKVTCPYKDCTANKFQDDTNKIYHFSDGKRFQCSCCDRIFSYKTATIFENTKIALKKWFTAIYLHTAHKKGISSCQLARDIDVTQKTAWFMLHRIREVAGDNFDSGEFGGVVEMD